MRKPSKKTLKNFLQKSILYYKSQKQELINMETIYRQPKSYLFLKYYSESFFEDLKFILKLINTKDKKFAFIVMRNAFELWIRLYYLLKIDSIDEKNQIFRNEIFRITYRNFKIGKFHNDPILISSAKEKYDQIKIESDLDLEQIKNEFDVESFPKVKVMLKKVLNEIETLVENYYMDYQKLCEYTHSGLVQELSNRDKKSVNNEIYYLLMQSALLSKSMLELIDFCLNNNALSDKLIKFLDKYRIIQI